MRLAFALLLVVSLSASLSACPGDYIRGVGLRAGLENAERVRAALRAFSEDRDLTMQDAAPSSYPYPADYQGFRDVAYLSTKPQAQEVPEIVVRIEESEAQGVVSVSISRNDLADAVCRKLHEADIKFRIDHDHERHRGCADLAQN